MFSLSDRIAVITGGASGIGLATARRFVNAGATVVLLDRENARTLAADIGATALRVDVTDAGALAAALDTVAGEHDRIDVLVNNAGIFTEGLIDDTSADELRKAFEVNTLGVLHGIRHATPHMRPGASIINTASQAGQTGFPGYAAYSASKAAVIALTRVAALEYGPRGIRVNCICPGSVDTPMLAGQPSGDVEAGLVSVAAPLGRIVDADEVAALMHFLAADDCPMLSGLAIPIDGGMSSGMSIRLTEAVVASLGSDVAVLPTSE
jgi:3alpha(or 20beta)-hydroxysteroid dehydrogenase